MRKAEAQKVIAEMPVDRLKDATRERIRISPLFETAVALEEAAAEPGEELAGALQQKGFQELAEYVLEDQTVSPEELKMAAHMAYRGSARPDYKTTIERIRRMLGDEERG